MQVLADEAAKEKRKERKGKKKHRVNAKVDDSSVQNTPQSASSDMSPPEGKAGQIQNRPRPTPHNATTLASSNTVSALSSSTSLRSRSGNSEFKNTPMFTLQSPQPLFILVPLELDNQVWGSMPMVDLNILPLPVDSLQPVLDFSDLFSTSFQLDAILANAPLPGVDFDIDIDINFGQAIQPLMQPQQVDQPVWP